MVEVKYSEQKDADLKNISDSLKIKTANPEFPGNQKYPKKNTRNIDALGKNPGFTA